MGRRSSDSDTGGKSFPPAQEGGRTLPTADERRLLSEYGGAILVKAVGDRVTINSGRGARNILSIVGSLSGRWASHQ